MHLPEYDYELVFIDNYSTDGTRQKLEQICSRNEKIKAIFNAKNFGQFNSPFTEFVKQQEIVPYLCAVIFRIRLILFHVWFMNGKRI